MNYINIILEYKKEFNKGLIAEELVDILTRYLTSALKDSFQVQYTLCYYYLLI